MAAKKCSKCGEEKPLDQFYKQAGCREGFRPDCIACVKSRVSRLHFADHAKSLLRMRESRIRHRDKRLAGLREYYRRNRPAFIKAVMQWARNNRAKVYAYQHNWRAAQRAGGKHTAAQIADLYKAQSGCCAACTKQLDKFHRDHVLPLSKGGSNDISNIQLLCPSCNTSKGARSMDEFLKTRSLKKEDVKNGRRSKHPSGLV